MTPQLTINLLGPFEAIASRGERLMVRSRRARALLACLAVEGGESWTRSRLATLLWSDRAEQQGRSSLRQELLQLRKSLGQTTAADWDNDGFLNLPKQVATDIGSLRGTLLAGEAVRAAALWRGDLLQDTPKIRGAFADWLALSRARLRKLAVEGFEHALRTSDDDQALSRLETLAQKLAMIDPGNETACRSLMRCAASRHDLVGVIARYQAYAAAGGPTMAAPSSAGMKRYLYEMIEATSRQQVTTLPRQES
jgi:DNA-binding SARP family transcriptional activator